MNTEEPHAHMRESMGSISANFGFGFCFGSFFPLLVHQSLPYSDVSFLVIPPPENSQDLNCYTTTIDGSLRPATEPTKYATSKQQVNLLGTVVTNINDSQSRNNRAPLTQSDWSELMTRCTLLRDKVMSLGPPKISAARTALQDTIARSNPSLMKSKICAISRTTSSLISNL
jgi:hypothetical protein